jgi:hypothetical protein
MAPGDDLMALAEATEAEGNEIVNAYLLGSVLEGASPTPPRNLYERTPRSRHVKT